MDFLKAILEKALFEQVEAAINAHNEAHKDAPCKIVDLSSGEYIGKGKHTALEEERNGLKTQLETLSGELATLRGKKTTDADTKAALEALQEKYNTDTAALTEKVQKAQFDGALSAALAKSGARNPKTVAALLDMSALKLENDALTGFDDQLATIRKDNDYLFEDTGAWGERHGSSAPVLSGVEANFYALNPNLKQ